MRQDERGLTASSLKFKLLYVLPMDVGIYIYLRERERKGVKKEDETRGERIGYIKFEI